jgi:protein-disulfide isomerase
VVVEYADLECPYCARAHLILKELPVQRVFRHFPVVSKHPRARVLAAAAELQHLGHDMMRRRLERHPAGPG